MHKDFALRLTATLKIRCLIPKNVGAKCLGSLMVSCVYKSHMTGCRWKSANRTCNMSSSTGLLLINSMKDFLRSEKYFYIARLN